MTSVIVADEVDRISSSGNGMLRTDDEEYNLGPLDPELVGNTVVAVRIDDTWAVCLTPHNEPETYFSDFCSAASTNREEIRQHVSEVGAQEDVLTEEPTLARWDPEKNANLEVGDTIEARITIWHVGRNYAIFADGTVIEIANTYLPPGTETTLEITATSELIPKAQIHASARNNRPQPGTELVTKVEVKFDNIGYAIHNGVPIVLPNCAAAEGDEVRVGVESLNANSVRATIPVLPESRRPAVGNILDLKINTGEKGSKPVHFVDGVPIEISNPVLSVDGHVPVEIAEIEGATVSGQLDFESSTRAPELGAELTIIVDRVTKSTGYALHDGVPIILPGYNASEGARVRAAVTDYRPTGVEATVAALPPDSRPAVGDVLEIDVALPADDSTTVPVRDGIPIEITQPALPMDGPITIEITELEENTVSGQPDFTSNPRAPELGAELTVTVDQVRRSIGYSLHDGVPIILPDYRASEGDIIHVAASECLTTGVKATVAALSTDSRPAVGDVLEIDVALPGDNSTTILTENNTPIEISNPEFAMEGELPIKITEVLPNLVAGRVELDLYDDLSEGDQITIEEFKTLGNRAVGRFEGIPVVVPRSTKTPSEPESLPVTITDIQSEAAHASIQPNSEIKTLGEESAITVTTTGSIGGYLIANYQEYPVWIKWQSSDADLPEVLTVEISTITDYGLFASLPALSDPDSASNVLLPADVEEVRSDHILLSAGEEQYVLPARSVLSFDISGEVGVEIVGQEQAHLISTIRTSEIGPDAAQVPTYLQELQDALLAIRELRFEDAAASAQTAAETTETAVRQAEALRFQIFTSAEAILSSGGTEPEASERISQLTESVAALDLPSAYRSLIAIEVEIYDELLSVGADSAPDSAQGLQRIAYNADVRSRVGEIARRIRRKLADAETVTEELDWPGQFPHPLVVYRVAELCTQFEYQPEVAANLIERHPSIDELTWRVAPVSTPEPTPASTVSVTPRSFEQLSGFLSAAGSDSEPSTAPDTSDTTSTETEDTQSMITDTDGKTATSSAASVTEDSAGATATDSVTPPGSIISPPSKESPEDDPPLPTSDGEERDDTNSGHGSSSDDSGPAVPDPTPPEMTSQLKTLRANAEAAASEDPVRDISNRGTSSRYKRASAIKEYVKARADGVCEACGEPAPFETSGGEPYLETHHVDELGQGGADHPDKVAAVCPTCHKRIHYGDDGDELNAVLQRRLENGLADVGAE